MSRVRTDSLGAAAGFQGAQEEAALPAHRVDAGLPMERQTAASQGVRIARLTARMLRDAGIAIAMMLVVPVTLVAVRGETLVRMSTFSAYVYRSIADVDALRPFAVPADASVSPIDAGRAFAALQPVKEQPGFIPATPAQHTGPSWREAQLSATLFRGARPDLYTGTSSRTILSEVAKGISTPEREYLRAVATGWEWREFDKVAHARQVDMLGGQLQLPYGENAYPEMRPAQFKQIREVAYAAVTRAAYHLAIGQRDSAEAILRSIVSVGFAMIDNGHSALDEMIGSSIVGVGREALRQFYGITNDVRATSPALIKPPKQETPAYRVSIRPGTPDQMRQRLIATVGDRRIPMGERFESLEALSRVSCTNVRELMFGPGEDVRRALVGARASLGRFPSERALIDVVEHIHQPDLADAGLNPLAEMAMSAATPPGIVLGNPRLAACARILASW